MKTRICNTCKKRKILQDFHRNPTSKHGRSPKCKTCFRKYYASWFNKNREKVAAKSSRYRARTRPRQMWISAKKRAKKLKVPFKITIEDIVIPMVCPLLGVELHTGEGRSPNSPSLDRILPHLGYIRGNVIVVSHRANTIKQDASPEELERIARNLRGILKPRLVRNH